MQQHGRKYFAYRPPSLGMVSVGQNATFSEHSHFAYQIKENHECCNMIACRPPNPGDGSRLNFFRTWSCFISNLGQSRMQHHGSKYFARRLQ